MLTWAKQAPRPQLILTSIKQISSQERNDELYILVSDLGTKHDAFYTIPGHKSFFIRKQSPLPTISNLTPPHRYWPASILPKLKNITLWDRGLTQDEGTQLVISLIEADMPPWNLDDLLGTVKFNLRNHDHQLAVDMQPFSHAKVVKQQQTSRGIEYTVEIKNGNANYVLLLHLLVKNNSQQSKSGQTKP